MAEAEAAAIDTKEGRPDGEARGSFWAGSFRVAAEAPEGERQKLSTSLRKRTRERSRRRRLHRPEFRAAASTSGRRRNCNVAPSRRRDVCYSHPGEVSFTQDTRNNKGGGVQRSVSASVAE